MRSGTRDVILNVSADLTAGFYFAPSKDNNIHARVNEGDTKIEKVIEITSDINIFSRVSGTEIRTRRGASNRDIQFR